MIHPKINKTFKEKWVTALESGKYKQTHNTLRGKYGFCCLGVACDLIAPNLWEKEDGDWFHENDPDMPSDMIRDRIKLDDETLNHLSAMNDGDTPLGIKRHSFKQIAVWIRKNL